MNNNEWMNLFLQKQEILRKWVDDQITDDVFQKEYNRLLNLLYP